MNTDRAKGFTLIELLVVIAIIGTLASVILASLNSARVKARNVRRLSDIQQLLNAFNLGLNGTNSLPYDGVTWECVSASCGLGWSQFDAGPTVDNFLLPYLPTKPSDPSDSSRGYNGYLYGYAFQGQTSSYDGTVFPPGSIIYWLMELPVSAGICGPGKISSVTTKYVGCFVYIN